MRPVVRSDAAAAAGHAAALIARRLRAEPDIVLGLATGRTMEPVYAELVRLHRQQALDFARCRCFNLDEYVGLDAADPQSYRGFMDRHLFSQVNVASGHTRLPDGAQADLAAEAARYEAAIRDAGGIGLQLLGIGETGHIGFNEPGSPLDSRTREVVLTARTREQNAAMFGGRAEDVPSRALTMGVGTILEAREILLLVTGASKAAMLARALQGPVTPAVTASALRTHPCCTVVADEAAAAELRERARDEPELPPRR